MAERKSKGEKLPSVKSVRSRSLSRLFLSLSLSFLALKRAFLSSKVALSENLSQIQQNCGREGNETRLLLREKDFEREHAEPKKAEPKKKQEREREKQKSKNKEREERELFFLFSFASLSLSLCVFSLSLLSCFFRFFFSRDDESLLRSSKTFKRTILFARRSLFLAHHTFLSL